MYVEVSENLVNKNVVGKPIKAARLLLANVHAMEKKVQRVE